MQINTNHRSVEKIIADVYQYSFPFIEGYICSLYGNKEDVADIIQDVCEVILNKKEYFANKPETLLKAYIIGIGRNLWLKELQKRRVIKDKLGDYAYWQKSENNHLDLMKLRNIEVFYKCLNKLKSEDRRILLEVKKGYKNQHIADKLGYRIEAFKKRKRSCFRDIMKLMLYEKDFSISICLVLMLMFGRWVG
jgi:RNA polymerase sigma factor (sigma-70 family)